MGSQPSLTLAEEKLLGHLRRLCKQARDFKIEVYGSFKSGHRIIELRPMPYERYDLDQLEQVFDAVD